jgi:hypothetical protein
MVRFLQTKFRTITCNLMPLLRWARAQMVDSTTPRTRMARGYRRWIGVIGLANGWHWHRPASPAQLGPARPRAHAAEESTI